MRYSAKSFWAAADLLYSLKMYSCSAIAFKGSGYSEELDFWAICHKPRNASMIWFGEMSPENQMLRQQLLGEMAINLREQGFDDDGN